MKTNLPFHVLSKSSFQMGLQCTKSLYLNKYHSELRGETSEKTKEVFETGHSVGTLAQKLFPGGMDCGFEITKSGQKSVELTAKAISDGSEVIYEAAFQHDGVLVIADIIVKSKNQWNIYEVKSSTSVSDYQINDTSVQYYIITKSGLLIDDISVIHINNKYVRQGEINVHQLFTIRSVKEKVISFQDFVENKIAEFKQVLNGDTIPEIEIGSQCNEPFECDFKSHCWKHIPDYSVFNLSYMGKKAFDLYKIGIVEIKDIPDDYGLSVNQAVEKNCFLGQKKYINKTEIKSFLNNLKYPLYFMDFESIQAAIPVFDNSRPYQQLVFQYSLYYKKDRKSEPEHFEFLGDGKTDPRLEFVEKLLKDTAGEGTILVYNASFEITRLKELAAIFPQYAFKLQDRISRIVDLMIPFQNRTYYKPDMVSRHSLKKVLPSINSDYSYSNLEIQEGGAAGVEYLRLSSLQSEEEINTVRKNLLDYCGRDTYGMIVILEELERIAETEE
ncbi:MAG: DUF2779 domain-containing protein [Ignavibacteriae bacterium]|nr:DUF2779 domain-containing protein [Ignavibacteriota bacterium]